MKSRGLAILVLSGLTLANPLSAFSTPSVPFSNLERSAGLLSIPDPIRLPTQRKGSLSERRAPGKRIWTELDQSRSNGEIPIHSHHQRRQDGQDESCREVAVCADPNETNPCCLVELDAICTGDSCPGVAARDDATAALFVTSTKTRTITVEEGIQITTVTSTIRQTLTFLDLLQRTQTNTVTVTAAPRRVRRDESSIAEPGVGEPLPSAPRPISPTTTETARPVIDAEALVPQPTVTATPASRNNAATVTSTLVIEVTTTVFLPPQSTITATVLNTMFVSLTLAPSATTTVTRTTTVQPPRPDLPGGASPPETSVGPPPTLSLLPSGSIITATGRTELPPGSTGLAPPEPTNNILPSGTVDPDVLQSMQPSSMPSDGPPPSPFPGSSLSTDEIAGIAVGAIFGLFLLVVAAVLVRRCIRRRRHKALVQHHRAMAQGATAIQPHPPILPTMTSALAEPMLPPPVAGMDGGSDTDSGPVGDGEVRIVIRPAPRRRPDASGLPTVIPGSSPEGLRGQWPRPPGYSGRTYSFFVEESGQTTPREPRRWSNASDFGTGNLSGRQSSQAYPGIGSGLTSGTNSVTPTGETNTAESTIRRNTQFNYNSMSNYSQDDRLRTRNDQNRSGPGAAGGTEFLTVGRAFSPWSAV